MLSNLDDSSSTGHRVNACFKSNFEKTLAPDKLTKQFSSVGKGYLSGVRTEFIVAL